MNKSHMIIAQLVTLSMGTPVAAGPMAFDGMHRSSCSPIALNGKAFFTRLALSFRGDRYASNETLFEDKNCQISVMETTSQGRWSVTEGTILRLELKGMQMRPLDPRMSDSLSKSKTCGKSWEIGKANEILNTSCGKGRQAEYFVGPSPSGQSLRLDECEGKQSVGPGCTHYAMARYSAKPLKTRASLASRRK